MNAALIAVATLAGYLLGARGRRSDAKRHADALLEWFATGLDSWSGDDEVVDWQRNTYAYGDGVTIVRGVE